MSLSITFLVLLIIAMLTAALYNAARYKPAFLSSQWRSYKADLGVDGNSDATFYHNSCFHSGEELTPWWMVDLRSQFSVVKIQLTNRDDNDAQRLRNFEIDIFEKDPRKLTSFPNISGRLCHNQTTSVDRGTYNFTCSVPIVGRFVRLVIKGSVYSYLHACEIEVLVNGSSIEEFLFSKSKNYKLSGSALAILTVTDQFICLRECLRRRSSSYCTAGNWKPESRSCELFSVNPFIDLSSNLTATEGTHFFLQNYFEK